MSIQVKDVTANLLVLTIDNNGQMYFGNGTPINMLSLDGYGIIDNNGVLSYGANSSSLATTSGSSYLTYQGDQNSNDPVSIQISTKSGVVPTVQLSSSYPSARAGSSGTTRINKPVVVVTAISSGSFTARNTSSGGATDAGSGKVYSPGTDGTFSYKWM